RGAARRVRAEQPRAAGDAADAAPRASGAAAADVCAGAREPARDRLDARIDSDAVVSRAPDADAAARRARAVHRLDVLLRRVGAEGALPGDPRAPAVRRGG